MLPFVFIGKEIERKAQQGEDISVVDNPGPIKYEPRRTAKTHAADTSLILRGSQFGTRPIKRASCVSQHAVERFLRGERTHLSTLRKIAKAIEKLERKARKRANRSWSVSTRDCDKRIYRQ
jgi:hypothetical protein